MAVDALMRSRGVPGAVSEKISRSSPVRRADKIVKEKVKRGSTKASRKLSSALKTVNKKARKKNGDFKKGYNQSRLMKEAHRMCK